MPVEMVGNSNEAEALKFKQKLENSEIVVGESENRPISDPNAEDSDTNFALDMALETLDGLEKAKAGNGDPQEAITFADTQLPVLYQIYEKMPGDNTPDKADLARKIREITEAIADLAEKSADQGIDAVEAQIANM